MDKTKALPCPFCGESYVGVKDEVLEINEIGNRIRVWAYCMHCGASGKTKTICNCCDEEKIHVAYRAWNERVTNKELEFTKEEILDLSSGMLALMDNINMSAKMIYDQDVIDNLKEVRDRYVKLNTKLCLAKEGES